MFLLGSYRVKTLLNLGPMVLMLILVEVARLVLIATEVVQLFITHPELFLNLIFERIVEHIFQRSYTTILYTFLSSFSESVTLPGKTTYKKGDGSTYASSLSSVPATSGNRSRVSTGPRSVLLELLGSLISNLRLQLAAMSICMTIYELLIFICVSTSIECPYINA